MPSSKHTQRRKDALSVTVTYDRSLAEVIGIAREQILLDRGATSGEVLEAMLDRHPDVMLSFEPTQLVFERNGHIPDIEERVADGDRYAFAIDIYADPSADSAAELMEPAMPAPLGESGQEEFDTDIAVPRSYDAEYYRLRFSEMDCEWQRVACAKPSCPICAARYEIEHGEEAPSFVASSDVAVLERSLDEYIEDFHTASNDLAEIEVAGSTPIANIPPAPPRQDEQVIYANLRHWRDEVYQAAHRAIKENRLWLQTEAGMDLLWYANIFTLKTYRQLCNRWHLEQGDAYGEFDFAYTAYVLYESGRAVEIALTELAEGYAYDAAFSNLLTAFRRAREEVKKI